MTPAQFETSSTAAGTAAPPMTPRSDAGKKPRPYPLCLLIWIRTVQSEQRVKGSSRSASPAGGGRLHFGLPRFARRSRGGCPVVVWRLPDSCAAVARRCVRVWRTDFTIGSPALSGEARRKPVGGRRCPLHIDGRSGTISKPSHECAARGPMPANGDSLRALRLPYASAG